jgi:hypothetical protein
MKHEARMTNDEGNDEIQMPNLEGVFRHSCFVIASTACCLLMLSGCGSDLPKLGAVKGKVTLDGKPLANAGVVFTPLDGGRQSMAVTDQDGNYELVYLRDIRGAKVGQHAVGIAAADGESAKQEPIPSRYNTQTTLRESVHPGANVINFTLTSK